MFFYRSTIEINGFSMVFPNSGAMVSDGFDLKYTFKNRIIFLKDTPDHTATLGVNKP